MKEECQNKKLIINTFWNKFFIQPLPNTGNPDKSTKTVPNDCCEYPKKPAKTSTLKDQRKKPIETTNRFSVLSPHEKPTDSMAKDSSLDSACERSAQIDKQRTTSLKKTDKIPGKNKLPVTARLGDLIVKDIVGNYLTKRIKSYLNILVELKQKTWSLILFPPLNKTQKQSSYTLGLTT